MKPLNRRLLIEITEEELKQGVFFVPVEEKVEEFLTAKVISCAPDCTNDLTGQTVVVHSFGKEEVTVRGKTYTFIGENHLICVEQIMTKAESYIKVPSSLVEEIIDRIDKSYDLSRTAKSRWHHSQILKLRLKEMKRLF